MVQAEIADVKGVRPVTELRSIALWSIKASLRDMVALYSE